MTDLVSTTIAAHGGLDAWRGVERVSANFRASGVSLKQRGPVAEAFTQLPGRVAIDTRMQKMTFAPFIAPEQRGIYLPGRTSVESMDGTLLEALDDPRGSLAQLVPGTPWSASQLLYFVGYSLWMYLTLPYNFLMDGVQCEEIEPLIENGETWRALKVTYPASFPSHSTEQIHYFDATGMMRRQDYSVDVRQDLSASHYIDGYREFDGFMFATERRIYLRGPDGQPMRDKLLISASLDDFKIERTAR
ncbi:hypothetical protein AB4851_13720 [Burkholderia sp. 22PA0099]|uniref:hypothetical protein n=1 Tax=Burkholderia sp. 22PA0099 TaxID=3237372 RepID=UPI0039C047A1